jgi:hypothetical protein
MQLVLVLLVALSLWGAYNGYVMRERDHPPGVLAPHEPDQRNFENATPYKIGDHTLTPRAKFFANARILHTERYRTGAVAAFSPIDVAIGWGPMSDSALLDQITLSQSGRFLFWKSATTPSTSWDVINRSAANLHVIPNDKSVMRKLASLRVGDLVDIEGDLVDVTRADGGGWNTSMTRDDRGAGACEIIYVRDVIVRSK